MGKRSDSDYIRDPKQQAEVKRMLGEENYGNWLGHAFIKGVRFVIVAGIILGMCDICAGTINNWQTILDTAQTAQRQNKKDPADNPLAKMLVCLTAGDDNFRTNPEDRSCAKLRHQMLYPHKAVMDRLGIK